MKSLSFLKLDFRMMKGIFRYFLLLPAIFLIFFMKENPILGIGYMFFLLVIVGTVLFSAEVNEECTKMYYMLPSKISHMVLGRFLYLSSLIIIMWGINGGVIWYFYSNNLLSNLELSIVCISGVVASIICLVQYPIYYKFGLEKGKMLSMIIYMVPSFIVFLLPTFLSGKNAVMINLINKTISISQEKPYILPILGGLIVVLVWVVSYIISCSICKNKEL
ncbi:ABC-2 transporter permease [Clostridium paridis]|uniref:ABC-2 transporter permease n=1 Tax=Clostridium paridis TaxID=2803863 RepID=A0A937FFJ3_9CLOT|nr:ABC-2 transporter permease [Clostridium paridis]MBL4930967.1 ABC-2 transporter permease [Clostridium paridis]